MSEPRQHALSLAFMRGHPEQAARVLEALPPDEAARLFGAVPARLAAAVLKAMMPIKAARCVDLLDDPRALELLVPMGAQPSIALLRQLPQARRATLLAGLPTATALASTLLMGYAQDALGAWADPDVLVLTPQSRVDDALARLQQSSIVVPAIFVADGQRRLLGMLPLATALQAPSGATLAGLMQPPAATLAAHAPLATVASHPGWHAGSLLPVLDQGGLLVGVLTHEAALRALARSAPGPETKATELTSMLAHGYWQALSGLLLSALACLPAPSSKQARP